MEEKKIIGLLENISAKVNKIEESLNGLKDSHKRLEDSHKRLEDSHKRLENSHKRLENSHKRLENRVEAIFELTGKNTEEIFAIKARLDNLETIKEDIRLIKHNLKIKADLEELESLETRVTSLERRFIKLSRQ